jgi:hypothetical protein
MLSGLFGSRDRSREAAKAVPSNRIRDAYTALAEGYEQLADLIQIDLAGWRADMPTGAAKGRLLRDELLP